MSEEEELNNEINTQLVMISGESGTGKSASLMNIPNQEKWMYLNCEAGKRLPFRNSFMTYKVSDPWQVYEGFDYAMANENDHNGIIIDTATFMMEMFESMYVLGAPNTQKAWGDYFQFWKNLLQDKVIKFDKPVLILAHTRTELDEKAMEMKTQVPVKGALKNNGLEAYFSTVVSTKRKSLTDLKDYKSDLLNITEEENDLGYKHVFQTKPTKQTIGERIRSPIGMFSKEQTFMDNDAFKLLQHMKEYYG